MEKGKCPGGWPGHSRRSQPGLLSTLKHGLCDDYPSPLQAWEPWPPAHLLAALAPECSPRLPHSCPDTAASARGPSQSFTPGPTLIPCQGVLADWSFGEGGESGEVRGILGEEILAVPSHNHINGLNLCHYPTGFQKPGELGLGPCSVVSPLEGPGPSPSPVWPLPAVMARRGQIMQEPHDVVLIQFRWHLGSALGRALICVHANQPAPAPALWAWATVGGLLVSPRLGMRGATATFWSPHEYLSSCRDPQARQEDHSLRLV